MYFGCPVKENVLHKNNDTHSQSHTRSFSVKTFVASNNAKNVNF